MEVKIVMNAVWKDRFWTGFIPFNICSHLFPACKYYWRAATAIPNYVNAFTFKASLKF